MLMDVRIKQFCYTGPAGGTCLSDGAFGERYPHPEATVKVTRGFFDYECGYRFIGEPADAELTAFRNAHGSAIDQRIFFSEFDLVDRKQRKALIAQVIDNEG
ncbi:MAG: hypothetical protein KGZ68_17835 [Dechloromonas sp.]|nr:hypothetical protein [Dechloromonas sp.]